MKKLSFYTILVCTILFNTPILAQQKETIKVWGNCGMCKKTIEKAAKDAGAISAHWNVETKELAVNFAEKKTSNLKIQQAVARSGYDTQDLTANDSTYNQLHGCCQYERKASPGNTLSKKCCDNASCDKEPDACKEMAACKEKACCKV